jgi:hypothetical protein
MTLEEVWEKYSEKELDDHEKQEQEEKKLKPKSSQKARFAALRSKVKVDVEER